MQFCCQGCRSVYEVLHGAGLERFYRMRESLEAAPMAARTTDRPYTEYDDPVFRGLYCEQRDDGTQATELYLEGVHCAACVWLVEKLPAVAPGVMEARLDMQRSLVRVRWDDTRIGLSQVARMLDSLGYPPHPAKDCTGAEVEAAGGSAVSDPNRRGGRMCRQCDDAWRSLCMAARSRGSRPSTRSCSGTPACCSAWSR